MTPHFSRTELACQHCGRLAFHPGFLEALEWIRVELGKSMILTSAARCTIHNAAVGGHPKSLHVFDAPQHPGQAGALAVDVATPDGAYRGRLFSVAWRLGFSIGWNAQRKFLHLDRRGLIGLPQTSFGYGGS